MNRIRSDLGQWLLSPNQEDIIECCDVTCTQSQFTYVLTLGKEYQKKLNEEVLLIT